MVHHLIIESLEGFIYDEIPILNKLFGVGLNNLEPYMLVNGLSTSYDELNLNYSASFVQTLNYAGLFGFIFLLAYLVSLGKRCKTPICKCLFALIVVIMAYESILYTFRFAFLIIFLEAFIRAQNEGSVRHINNRVSRANRQNQEVQ